MRITTTRIPHSGADMPCGNERGISVPRKVFKFLFVNELLARHRYANTQAICASAPENGNFEINEN
jgi:hypothetical protein